MTESFRKISQIRSDFPAISSDLIYLDNASTSLKPQSVIDSVNSYYTHQPFLNSRGNRGYLINQQINDARAKIKNFLNLDTKDQIIFTESATNSSNFLANSIKISLDDEVILCREDHGSTILPWIHQKCQIKSIDLNCSGNYSSDDIFPKITDRTRVAILTHIHNLYGSLLDIEVISQSIKQQNPNTIIIVDASQSVGHQQINFQKLPIDFLYFSGHKILSILGVGVICAKANAIQFLTPTKFGGGHHPFEVGSLNVASILSLSAAIDYLSHLGLATISNKISSLTRYLYQQLLTLPDLEFSINQPYFKSGIISFKIKGLDHAAIGEILENYHIIIRASDFCNEDTDYIRVSLNFYNQKSEIDYLIKVLRLIINQQI